MRLGSHGQRGRHLSSRVSMFGRIGLPDRDAPDGSVWLRGSSTQSCRARLEIEGSGVAVAPRAVRQPPVGASRRAARESFLERSGTRKAFLSRATTCRHSACRRTRTRRRRTSAASRNSRRMSATQVRGTMTATNKPQPTFGPDELARCCGTAKGRCSARRRAHRAVGASSRRGRR